ncbi:hypothetical protein NLU13_7037 [Sarocladium strictum]|uniref:Uncharacterized protein n=1 Tax=Sarocladium strictum TaxID=5046 RepID=A0AA39GEI5_SARSR|nr:hypothetical protein NLU13_7037 [Sarocladium strictum]
MIKPHALLVPRRRSQLVVAASVFTFMTMLLALVTRGAGYSSLRQKWATDSEGAVYTEVRHGPSTAARVTKDKLHILLPATRSNPNFCKTLMTMTILGYPAPTIIGWGGREGGSSHYMKITNSLAWIEDHERNGQPEFEEEIVFMMDAYDVWFQLPPEVLLARYERILREEDARVKQRLGKAFRNEHLETGVIFGAGKRCIPNMPSSISCYAVPDSPVPHDIYGAATDTSFGVGPATSFRTRYLNSGSMIGKVKHMRKLLKAAAAKMRVCKDRQTRPDDSRGRSGQCDGGSDQSIFIEMLGEQEYHREIMRRHHRGIFDDVLDWLVPGRAGSWPKPWNIYGAVVTDPLNPEFPHRPHNTAYHTGKLWDFGIALDYFADLGHQGIDAERDIHYIMHDQPIAPQLSRQSPFDCRNPRSTMPDDIPRGNVDLLTANGPGPRTWQSVPLLSEVCMDTIPVMIHHNAMNNSRLETEWEKPWWHGRARKMLEWREKEGAEQLLHGFMTDVHMALTWSELCPARYDQELYREGKPKPVEG